MSECWVVYVSSFLPRKCGIATFTADVTGAMDALMAPAIQSWVVAMNADEAVPYLYPDEVIFQIYQESETQYLEVAEKINRLPQVQLINIQHEFGLHGGEWGSKLIPFLEAVKKPVVITFHTILPQPEETLHKVVKQLAASVAGIIVPTYYARKILFEDYSIPEEKIIVIPHGIPVRAYTHPEHAKSELGLSRRAVLTTFGLLSRGKGLEFAIEALPEVVRRYPNVIYNILGATHPNIIKAEGESYRESLMQRVKELGLSHHVKFYNRFFALDELLKYLEATDVYISTSLDPNQAVSGTLSYALGMGRPVVSTSFAQAREYVTSDVGVLVDFGSPQSYTDAIIRLLEDEPWRISLSKNAFFRTRRMTWPNVAVRYLRCFSRYAPEVASVSWQKNPPPLKIDHLLKLTDDFGVIQFANLADPAPESGYTLDDNARALMAASLCYAKLRWDQAKGTGFAGEEELIKLVQTYLNFVEYVARLDGRFRNYVNQDRTFNRVLNRKESPEDASGRAFCALAETVVSTSSPDRVGSRALRLIEVVLNNNVRVTSPRAMAFHIKGLCSLLGDKRIAAKLDTGKMLEEYCNRLVSLFKNNSSSDWQWFEDCLTYSNAVLPESLLRAYQVTGNEEYLDVGKSSLEFLIKESFIDGVYTPVGQEGWHHRHGERSRFDQQPVDVTAMVLALKVCYTITGEEKYRQLMRVAFNWFLGDNSVNRVMYDYATGGCYDGLGEEQINLNEGAESTVSYLIARLNAFD